MVQLEVYLCILMQTTVYVPHTRTEQVWGSGISSEPCLRGARFEPWRGHQPTWPRIARFSSVRPVG